MIIIITMISKHKMGVHVEAGGEEEEEEEEGRV
jgi:hypothetical protein